MSAREQTVHRLATRVARGLERGTLTLAQAAGLTPVELQALADAAHQLRRQGNLEGAAELLGLLVSCDPYTPSHWLAMARVQQRLGHHPVVVVCLEILSLLEREPRPELQQLEAACLREMGQHDLAHDLLQEEETR